MARHYRIIASIAMDTALPEDVCVNTWHFLHENEPPGTTPQDSANDMIDQLEEFYTGIDGVIYPAIVGTSIECRAYDMADPEPRVPVLTRIITIAPTTATPLPPEMAVCLSMKADVESGEIAARRRGRVYVGPLQVGLPGVTSGKVIVSASYTGNIADNAELAFRTGLTGSDPYLCVYSRTEDEGGASVADSFHKVTSIYVDNAFDVQRRRGHESTARLTRAFPGR